MHQTECLQMRAQDTYLGKVNQMPKDVKGIKGLACCSRDWILVSLACKASSNSLTCKSGTPHTMLLIPLLTRRLYLLR